MEGGAISQEKNTRRADFEGKMMGSVCMCVHQAGGYPTATWTFRSELRKCIWAENRNLEVINIQLETKAM